MRNKTDYTATAIYATLLTANFVMYSEPVSTSEEFMNDNAEEDIYNEAYLYDQVDSNLTPIQTDQKTMIKDKIKSFGDLPNNWDGYGAKAPSVPVISNSLLFIELLQERFLHTLDKDNIFPAPHGTILLEWYLDEKSISVEIGKTKIGYYSTNLNSDVSQDGADFLGIIPFELSRALNELHAEMPEWTFV